jgi:hypothetical protein
MKPGISLRHVWILVFDEVEVLDFAGPFEVFGVTGIRSGPAPSETPCADDDACRTDERSSRTGGRAGCTDYRS